MMATRRTVYGISFGEYSDYSVGLLFDTEELAKEYVAVFGDGYIEEFDLWDGVPHRLPIHHLYFEDPSAPGRTNPRVYTDYRAADDAEAAVWATHQPTIAEDEDTFLYWHTSGNERVNGYRIHLSGPDLAKLRKLLRDRLAARAANS